MNAGGTTAASNFTLTKGAAGLFGISGANFVTERSSTPPGIYTVRIHGVATNAYYANDCYFGITIRSQINRCFQWLRNIGIMEGAGRV